jgi:hypothetical protein
MSHINDLNTDSWLLSVVFLLSVLSVVFLLSVLDVTKLVSAFVGLCSHVAMTTSQGTAVDWLQWIFVNRSL